MWKMERVVCIKCRRSVQTVGTAMDAEKITKSTSPVVDGVRLYATILLQYITSGGCGSTTLVLVAGLVVVHLINDGSWPVCSFVLFLFFGLCVWYIIRWQFLCHVVQESLNVMMTIYIKHFTNLKAHKREHKTSLFLYTVLPVYPTYHNSRIVI